MTVMVVELRADWIARCPERSFKFHHYRQDGSCRCYPDNAAERNIRAERRAVEEGHRAMVQDDGSIKVVSDSYDGKHYVVTYVDSGNGIRFSCRPEGRMAYRDDHLELDAEPGVAPCKHAAVAARRLEREGLAVFIDAGIWRAISRTPPPPTPDDPLEGLPR
jgi:hypothetical protein